jgi:hypothetical protein
MELPAEVLIHNETVGIKGSKGTLLTISPHGYYEANVRFGERVHRVLLPIADTALIAAEPEEAVAADAMEIERGREGG